MCVCVWARYDLYAYFLLNWAYQFQRINAHFVCFDWNTHQNLIHSALCVHTFFFSSYWMRSNVRTFPLYEAPLIRAFFIGCYEVTIDQTKLNWCQFTFIGRALAILANFGFNNLNEQMQKNFVMILLRIELVCCNKCSIQIEQKKMCSEMCNRFLQKPHLIITRYSVLF